MTVRKALTISVVGRLVLLLFTAVVLISMNDSETAYIRIGPGEHLIVLGVRINTMGRYATLLAIVTVVGWTFLMLKYLGDRAMCILTLERDVRNLAFSGEPTSGIAFLEILSFSLKAFYSMIALLIILAQIDLAAWGMFAVYIPAISVQVCFRNSIEKYIIRLYGFEMPN